MDVLVVGGGKMGMSHLALLTQYLGKSRTALCDTKLVTRLLFRMLGYKVYRSLESARSCIKELSGVVVSTPTNSHYSIAKWAIERDIPVFIEKPMTLNIENSKHLLDLANIKGLVVQVGFVMRYVKTFQMLRKLIRDGFLGNVIEYEASMCGNVVTKTLGTGSWQGTYALGGGCLNEYGPHVIDLCRFLFGAIKKIESARMKKKYSIDADDKIWVDCTHDDNFKGKIHIDWCDPSRRKSVIEVKVVFEGGTVRADNSAIDIEVNDDFSGNIDELKAYKNIIPNNVKYYLRGEEFSLEMEAFLSSIRQSVLGKELDKKYNDYPGVIDGYEADKIIHDVAKMVGLK